MESNLLTSAKHYQKKRRWEKAIAYYSQYMDESNEQLDDTIYVSYAKCLRYANYTNHAQALLMDGKSLYPDSERILQELYVLYDFLSNWEFARTTANELIELNPEQADHYFRLGKAYAYLLDYKKAEETYLSGLKYKHGMSFAQLIEQIKRGFTNYPAAFSSDYVFINGKNNFGAFIHRHGNKEYFTKISKRKKNTKREMNFYKNVRTSFSALQAVVPGYIDVQDIDGIIYLTTEMIEGDAVSSNDVKGVIDASAEISTVRYKDLISMFSNPDYFFQIRNRPITVIHFFTQIHKKYYNEKLFSGLYKLVKQNNYPASVKKVIQRVESQIMKNNLYVFMNPNKYFSLLHGDFNTTNIKIDKQNGMPQVFDWASFTTGPHFIDIARYLSGCVYPFATIKEIYLTDEETGGKLTSIEKIFFLYALIFLYILRLKEKNVKKHMNDCIIPALKDLEKSVLQFRKKEYDSSVLALREEKDESERQVKELKEKVIELENLNKENET